MTALRRRSFLGACVAACAAWRPVRAQQAAPRGARVAWMTVAPHPMIEPFRAAMRELGYDERSNLKIEYRYAEGAPARLPHLAAELEASGEVDVIVASGGAALSAVQARTRKMPVVGIGADLVGIVGAGSLARPGGNITGLSLLFESVSAKWPELARDLLPKVERIAALTEEANVSGPRQMAVLVAAARAGSIDVVPLSVAASSDLERAFDAARGERVDAMVVLSSALFAAEKRQIIELAAQARLPTIYEHRDFTESGGLVSYGPDLRAVFRRAAVFVDRILKGTAPGELPIEQPTNFELVVNLRTATALGLAVPPSLIARADEVIE